MDTFNLSADMLMDELHSMADTNESFLLCDLLNRATVDVIMRVRSLLILKVHFDVDHVEEITMRFLINAVLDPKEY